MTLWPDQPNDASAQPQTRRQAREKERTASRRAGTAESTPAGEIPEMTATAGSAQQNAQQQAAQQQASQQQESAQPQPAAPERPAIPATAFAEPLVTPPSRPASAQGGATQGAAPQAAQQRPAAGSPGGLFQRASDPKVPEPVTQPVSVLTSDQPAASGAAPERTLTRRELRAMLQAQEANQASQSPQIAEPVAPVAFASPASPRPQSSAPQQAAAPAPAPEAETPSSSAKSAWPFAPLAPSAAPATASAAHGDRTDTTVTQTAASESPFTAFGLSTPAPGSAGAAAQPSAAQPSAAQSSAARPAPAADRDAAQERRPFTPPTGHWSTAAELDDKNEPIISRNVGQSTAATTTNALILPAIPQPDATAPLTSTGEILVTGSIDLPRGMGATGANPQHLDSSDIDRLLDGEENEFNTSEVAPVRASRAISSHSSTRGVITPPKKRGNTLPVVLMVTAGVLAVGVIGLLIAAYVLRVF
ncbi:hypothetical protein P5G50_11935 [Leifsonia sp. F6_8S_P_1B]|uniref:Meckel syndrome type 1 protein n=1 Tax=Leifsonia williamsii TaxID=3035919 RepID=A0ABT8KCG5_9MICO|nr:hypothetical protein [Leifsonia williamsii]MDN4615158.1 hypothetical protein [Leifsonia williamsii]